MGYLDQIDEICCDMDTIFELSQDIELPVKTSQETLFFRYDVETNNWLLYVSFLDGKAILGSIQKFNRSLSAHCNKFPEYMSIVNAMQSYLQLQEINCASLQE